jgi:hypothetical protein
VPAPSAAQSGVSPGATVEGLAGKRLDQVVTLAELPPFPVDDDMLDRLEHALNTTVDPQHLDERGRWLRVGGEYTLSELLDFYSGYDKSKLIPVGPADLTDTFEYPDPIYHPSDVIRALVAEVRKLRAQCAN